ncbi:MAG: fibronectin type III domain-containing protein [Clostridia bacterium]|nr:fibronectin type III domain-containing protein [Clostridia bacterium]
MKKHMLWRALVAALLCAALLCPTFALAEADGLTVNDLADDALELEMNEAFDGAVPDLPDLDLPNLDLLGDLALDDDLVAGETGPIDLGGGALSNTGDTESGDSQETPSPKDVVTLVASYTGGTLSKAYDCNKYGAVKDTNTGEIIYVIEALKTILSQFELTPAKGKTLVEGHENVSFKLTLTKQFDAADVGKYTFEFTLSLTGDDAAWYTLKNPVVKVPARITRRVVTVSPRENLVKAYGAADPVYPSGTNFILRYTNGEIAVQQDVSGLPTYAVPTFTSDQLTNVKYLIKEAQLKERDFFPGFLGRKAGEKAGKYRVTRGTLSFGSNFKLKVAEGYFTIKPRDIGDSEITVSTVTDKTFTGKAIKPKPVLRFNGKRLKLGTAYRLNYSHNKPLGNATVTITGKGNFTGTRKLTFRIVLKPTAISKLTAGKGQIAVKWKKGKLNKGYEIAYSTDADFFSSQTKTVKGINRTQLTLKNLQSQTTYYVRIRTYRKVSGVLYYSAWSKTKEIRTK